jgi:hypothetical protein
MNIEPASNSSKSGIHIEIEKNEEILEISRDKRTKHLPIDEISSGPNSFRNKKESNIQKTPLIKEKEGNINASTKKNKEKEIESDFIAYSDFKGS